MGVSEARSAVRRARRDQLLALASIAGASVRLRLAKGRLGLHRRVARWRKHVRKRLRHHASSARGLDGWLG
jgi:hypothetical protein